MWPCMEVPAGSRNAGVSESGLHQMNWRAAVESVAGMGVAHPVRRHLWLEPGFPRRGIDDAADLGNIERSPALAAPKNGIGRLGFSLDG